jgi:predicted RNA-binding Zn ribbon-like protein
VTDINSSAASANGGDPAPGPLRLVQSFANTLSLDPETDLFQTREEAAAWLHKASLLPTDAGLTNSEYAALLRLRDSLRDALAAHTTGRADAAAAARLTRALADGRLVLTVDPASALHLASAARSSYPNTVAIIGIAIADSAANGTWMRLKSCSVPNCGQAFYDGSGSNRCSTHVTGGVTTGRSD